MEEQRLALAVARELDLAQEERVVAAPVRAHDARDQVCERALDERRVVHELEQRLRPLVADAAGEVVGEPCLPRLEHVDAEARPLVQQVRHARAAVDRHEDERRAQRDGHEGVRGHAVHLLARPGRDDGDSGREHPQRAPERDRRVAFEAQPELELLDRRRRVERGTERLGRGDRAVERDLELFRSDRLVHRP